LDPYPGTRSQQIKVKRCVKEWEKYANITFEHADSPDAIIRIMFDSGSGSWSHIGRNIEHIPLDQPTMNLGWIGDSEDDSEIDRGVILHEFGHTLGLLHEHQQSPARGKKLTLKTERKLRGLVLDMLSLISMPAIIEFYTKQQQWSEEDVRTKILSVYNGKGISNYSTLDLKSIMLCVWISMSMSWRQHLYGI
jgi:Astacin (Peptidase family M12A)